MSHDHSHGDHGHDHDHLPQGADAGRKIMLAMVLTGAFMVVEVVGGLMSGSLALIADAGHMATDFASLLLAYAGIHLGKRRADQQRSYGYRRFEVLAAFVNGITLLALTAWIVFEAVQRLATPVEVLSRPMLVVAVLGLAVNLAAYAILRQGGSDNVNVGGALIHVLGDLLGSLAAIVAAVVIWRTGWTPIDPILSLFVALLIIRSGWQIVRRSGHILLEGTPPGVDAELIKRDLEQVKDVAAASHIHVWSLTTERLLATLHIRVVPGADAEAVLRAVKSRLAGQFGIEHSTVEIDFDGGPVHPHDGHD
jgi:cobalt-zinc-cadmium efflux system protein